MRKRVEGLHAAGADHTAVQVITGRGGEVLPREERRRLAEILQPGSV